MAFLFKSKNKQGLPPATRGLTSADDSSATGLNGISPSEKELRARTGPTPPPGSASALAARAATPDQFNLQQSEKQVCCDSTSSIPLRPLPSSRQHFAYNLRLTLSISGRKNYRQPKPTSSSRCVAISVVAATSRFCQSPAKPVSALWRCHKRRRLAKGRFVLDGRPHKWGNGKRRPLAY